MKIRPIIGLEIHVQLKTKSKMFCGCSAQYFGAEPNTHMCPVCLALPGALPRANKKALENAIKVGIALHCRINNFSKFDRKNYMYPDLFKGYQITQYEIPICEEGYVDLKRGDGSALRVGIIRAHQEEDTAKSIHEDGYTLVDGNKAGVPLLEIVSAPDMTSVEDATLFAEYVYTTLRFIGVSDCDMEKGQMRFDVNVNVEIEQDEKDGRTEKIATPIVEIKNLNSFRSMQRALAYEISRQQEEYEKTGIAFGKGNKTTRGWSDDKGHTYLLRSKEEAEDYRYFPDPDLPPVVFSDEEIEQLKNEIGKLPHEIQQEYISLGLNADTALYMTSARSLFAYFEIGRKIYNKEKNLANWMKGDLAFAISQRGLDVKDIQKILPVDQLVGLLQQIDSGVISHTAGKEVLADMLDTHESAESIISKKGLAQVGDSDEMKVIVEKVIGMNESAVINYKAGKSGALMFLVGQVMKEMKGKGNPAVITSLIESILQ